MEIFKVSSVDDLVVELVDITSGEIINISIKEVPPVNRWMIRRSSEFNLYELLYSGREMLYPLELNCW